MQRPDRGDALGRATLPELRPVAVQGQVLDLVAAERLAERRLRVELEHLGADPVVLARMNLERLLAFKAQSIRRLMTEREPARVAMVEEHARARVRLRLTTQLEGSALDAY